VDQKLTKPSWLLLKAATHTDTHWMHLLAAAAAADYAKVMLHRIHRAAAYSNPPGFKPYHLNLSHAAAAADYEKIMLHRIHHAAREAQQLAGNYEEWKLKDVEWFKDTTAALHNHLQVG
jgi:hypothetical protein